MKIKKEYRKEKNCYDKFRMVKKDNKWRRGK